MYFFYSIFCSNFVRINKTFKRELVFFVMLVVLMILWGSAIIGYLLRHWPQVWVSRLLAISIWIMLFAIGIEVGSNEVLIASLNKLGAEALLITLLTTLCCGIGSFFLWKCLSPCKNKLHSKQGYSTSMQQGLWTSIRDSVIILVCFVFGCMMGFFGVRLPDRASFYSLCVLLMCVGFGIGQNTEIHQNFQHIGKGLVLMPLITILAT